MQDKHIPEQVETNRRSVMVKVFLQVMFGEIIERDNLQRISLE